jgi:hypothetical protein
VHRGISYRSPHPCASRRGPEPGAPSRLPSLLLVLPAYLFDLACSTPTLCPVLCFLLQKHTHTSLHPILPSIHTFKHSKHSKMSSYATYTCEPTLSAVATAHVAVISTVVTSSPTAATAHVAVVSSTNTSSSDQATAHAALNSLIGQEAGVEDGNKVETDRIAVKHADVSVLKSCLKKANVVSPIPKIAKQVEWNAMHEYQIYDVQLEERTDTGKFALDAGEINWADWRAQKKWNEKNFDIIDAEWRMIVYKMDNVADWDPGK